MRKNETFGHGLLLGTINETKVWLGVGDAGTLLISIDGDDWKEADKNADELKRELSYKKMVWGTLEDRRLKNED